MRIRKKSPWLTARKNYDHYLSLIPGVVFVILIRYMPMYGLVTAFQDYNIHRGIGESPFVGFKHFMALFDSPKILRDPGQHGADQLREDPREFSPVDPHRPDDQRDPAHSL
jgi:ABC-type sugar transport system permease subunit